MVVIEIHFGPGFIRSYEKASAHVWVLSGNINNDAFKLACDILPPIRVLSQKGINCFLCQVSHA
ncbi:MAG: hypothetical protein AMJ65_08300 [Phycisphaerae bacterium SG8_4]|nr:MAG: hypothetical protein AMJ65_08300 [Phycisphaerae bacterium SG8_4]